MRLYNIDNHGICRDYIENCYFPKSMIEENEQVIFFKSYFEGNVNMDLEQKVSLFKESLPFIKNAIQILYKKRNGSFVFIHQDNTAELSPEDQIISNAYESLSKVVAVEIFKKEIKIFNTSIELVNVNSIKNKFMLVNDIVKNQLIISGIWI